MSQVEFNISYYYTYIYKIINKCALGHHFEMENHREKKRMR